MFTHGALILKHFIDMPGRHAVTVDSILFLNPVLYGWHVYFLRSLSHGVCYHWYGIIFAGHASGCKSIHFLPQSPLAGISFYMWIDFPERSLCMAKKIPGQIAVVSDRDRCRRWAATYGSFLQNIFSVIHQRLLAWRYRPHSRNRWV